VYAVAANRHKVGEPSPYDDHGLVDAVAAIVNHVRPDEPEEVTQREFDVHRGDLESFPHVPTAKQICARLDVAWPRLLTSIVNARRRRWVLHSVNKDELHWLTENHVAAAVRAAGVRVGKPGLAPHEYTRERANMLREDRRRWLHGGRLVLPTVHQILRVMGTWDRAVELAGLDPQARHPRKHTGGVSIEEAMERFLETQGALPSLKRLAAFASTQGFPLARQARPMAESIDLLRSARAERGLWTPPRMPRGNKHPPYDFTYGSTRKPGEQRKRKRITRDDCVESVITYLDELPARTKASQKHYTGFATGRPDVVAASSISLQEGGWSGVLAEARSERRRRARR
jgi:hypothetical protein